MLRDEFLHDAGAVAKRFDFSDLHYLFPKS